MPGQWPMPAAAALLHDGATAFGLLELAVIKPGRPA